MRNVVEKKENALLLRVRFGQGNGNRRWSCCWACTRTGIEAERGAGTGEGVAAVASAVRHSSSRTLCQFLFAVADVTVITFPHKAHCAVIAKVAVLKPLTAVYIPAVSTVNTCRGERSSVGENL